LLPLPFIPAETADTAESIEALVMVFGFLTFGQAENLFLFSGKKTIKTKKQFMFKTTFNTKTFVMFMFLFLLIHKRCRINAVVVPETPLQKEDCHTVSPVVFKSRYCNE
jgi:hypothetical protein